MISNYYSNNVNLEMSSASQADPMKKVGSFSTVQIEQSPIQFELPEERNLEEIETLNMDDLFTNSESETKPSGAPLNIKKLGGNLSEATGGTDNGTTSANPFATSLSGTNLGVPGINTSISVPDFGGGSSGGTSSGDAGPSVGDGGAIGGSTANGIDERLVFAENVEYTAPDFSTSDVDINIETLEYINQNPEAIIGQMTPEQYAAFITGIENYYDGQLTLYNALLNGYEGQMGYYGYLYWIVRFLDDNQLLVHTPEEEFSHLDDLKSNVLTKFNSYSTPESFSRTFPNANISLQEFKQLSEDEQWQFLLDQNYSEALEIELYRDTYIQNINQKIAEEFGDLGITTYEELIALRDSLNINIIQIEQAINLTNNLKQSAQYDYLPYLKDYKDFDFSLETFTALNNMSITEKMAADSMHKNGGTSVSTLKNIYQYCPQYAKTYEYLYRIDPEKAKEYLKACEYQINSIRGQISAQGFLNLLGEADDKNDVLEAVANAFGIKTMGLLDGTKTFGEGVNYSLEALFTLCGLDENRQMSVEEYKRLYILQALLPDEDKEKLGLIIKNPDGTYSNNLEANPFQIVDFTKNYSGVLLDDTYSFYQGLGNMLPTMAISYINPTAGAWMMGISSGGNAYHSAMVDGKAYTAALFYGLFTGASEVITEKTLGALPFMSNANVNSFGSFAKAIGREGGEEIFQGALDLLFRAAVLGEPLPDLNDKDAWLDIGLDLLKQGGFGALAAGYLQAPNLILSQFNISGYNNFMAQNGITSEQQQNAIQQLRETNANIASLSDYEIKLNYGQEIASIAMINKTAGDYSVSYDAATVMLAMNVDAKTATYMVDNHVSLAEAKDFNNRVVYQSQNILKIMGDNELNANVFELGLSLTDDPIAFTQAFIELAQNPNYNKSLNLKDIINIRSAIDTFQTPSKVELQNNLNLVEGRVLDKGYYTLANGIYELSLNNNISFDSKYGAVVKDLKPNSVYTITYQYDSYEFDNSTNSWVKIKKTDQLTMRTNKAGVGYIPELYKNNASNSNFMLELDNNLAIKSFELDTSDRAFNPNSIGAKTLSNFAGFGVDQDILTMKFSDKNVQGLYQNALNGGNNSNVPYPFYRTINIVKRYIPSLSNSNIIQFLRKVNSNGACSFASMANMLFIQFQGKEATFAKIFGYNIYRFDERGHRILNSEYLLADYYTFANQNNPNLFRNTERGKQYTNPKIHADYCAIPSNGINKMMFQDFINFKMSQAGVDPSTVSYNLTLPFSSKNGYPTSTEIYSTLNNGMNKGVVYNLDVFVDKPKGHELVMYQYNGETGLCDQKFSSDVWFEENTQFEAGLKNSNDTVGHAMTIVQVAADGMYVQSWGNLYFIPYNSLNNVRFSIAGLDMNINP